VGRANVDVARKGGLAIGVKMADDGTITLAAKAEAFV